MNVFIQVYQLTKRKKKKPGCWFPGLVSMVVYLLVFSLLGWKLLVLLYREACWVSSRPHVLMYLVKL